MSNKAAIALATQLLTSFIPDVHNFFINAFDKVGFDLDTTGRSRHTKWMAEQLRVGFWNNGYGGVNIAIWNMHLNEDHHFENILVSGLERMGNGGGFRFVVFQGGGWLRNNGDRGYENWLCSGNQSIKNNVITFNPIN
ncbi:hypothetical protein BMF77_01522 [Dolichospermum sp. UHCC 0315A]|jgi:hypothetical protein|uniref:hypothetical protein n=1 Tax=Dolichospermum sp. UHCC 0315A TaxID=1914871 RepID=UPI0011E84779|nr:hypothetical protein [Dolichospermum sp. UHCC 0315A]QEI40940.1 hypothetical protein BMF77_01522 [Dolichospermum sp. UHCC 0315A]